MEAPIAGLGPSRPGGWGGDRGTQPGLTRRENRRRARSCLSRVTVARGFENCGQYFGPDEEDEPSKYEADCSDGSSPKV